MVSPLKLWHHPQPKQLWPALGALSILAHVGVLGLSLPYVLDLMQSKSSSAPASAVPIELVDADSAEGRSSAAVSTRSPAPSQTVETPRSQVSRSASPTQSSGQISSQSPGALSRSNSANAGAITPASTPLAPVVPSSIEERNTNQDESSGDRAKRVENDRAGAEGDRSNDEKPNTEDSDSGASGDEFPDTTPATPAGDANSSDELPTFPGDDNPLPLPGDSTNRETSGKTSQSASLRIVGFSEVPTEMQRDLADVPPRLKESAPNQVTFSPIPSQCPSLNFTQQRQTYRIAVKADGSVLAANVWTGGVGGAVTDEESAIACLIENAGFVFEPALIGGEPNLNDNLLLTIDLVEIQ